MSLIISIVALFLSIYSISLQKKSNKRLDQMLENTRGKYQKLKGWFSKLFKK